jgi:hypothetical protein
MARRHHHHHHHHPHHSKKHHHHKKELVYEPLGEEEQPTPSVWSSRWWLYAIAAVLLVVLLAVVVPILVVKSESSSSFADTTTTASSTGAVGGGPGGGGVVQPGYPYADVYNFVPRTDVNGDIMDVHDGNVLFLNGTFYWFGASYGPCLEVAQGAQCGGLVIGCCGLLLNQNVSLFTSTDFVNWHPSPRNPVLQFATDVPRTGVMFCPKALFNRATGRWVLWYNYIVNEQFQGYLGVSQSVSSSPDGPYVAVNVQLDTLANGNPGDFNLWVDDNDADAYLIYTSLDQGHGVSIEKLADDYLSTLGPQYNSGVFIQGQEAPAMFKRNGTYYAASSAECAYCSCGADATVSTSTCPLGPYTVGPVITSAPGGNQCPQTVYAAAPGEITAQETDVLSFWDNDGNAQYLWRGDRWYQSPDGEKGHDPTYLGLIAFDAASGGIEAVDVVVNFTLVLGQKPLDAPTSVSPTLFCPYTGPAMVPGQVYGFETVDLTTPATGTAEYNPPTSGTQPFTGTGGKFGVASTANGFNPGCGCAADGTQFAFLQNSQTVGVPTVMTTHIGGVAQGASYVVSWYQAVRGVTANPTSFQLNVTYNGTAIYASAPNVGDASGGWALINSTLPIAANGTLAFVATPAGTADQALLLDRVFLRPA